MRYYSYNESIFDDGGNLWALEYLCSDEEVDNFFDVMGGVVNVLGIIE